MSYEINVLVINQETPVHVSFSTPIILLNEIEQSEFFGRYFKIWPFFSCTKGVLYTLVQEVDDDFYSSFPLCDSDFETSTVDFETPEWITEEARSCLTPLIIHDHVYEDFKRIISYLIETSPNGLIMFHTRYEWGDTEIISGTLSVDQFFELLEKRRILFNTCYIISQS